MRLDAAHVSHPQVDKEASKGTGVDGDVEKLLKTARRRTGSPMETVELATKLATHEISAVTEQAEEEQRKLRHVIKVQRSELDQLRSLMSAQNDNVNLMRRDLLHSFRRLGGDESVSRRLTDSSAGGEEGLPFEPDSTSQRLDRYVRRFREELENSEEEAEDDDDDEAYLQHLEYAADSRSLSALSPVRPTESPLSRHALQRLQQRYQLRSHPTVRCSLTDP
mmetsp:Transcript_14601/g.34315  ORF Transcript_14601/g.34315 Transcript_14601/m.34315 type:complete len:222 (+) Transcript_14601:345-1010(+)